MRFIIHGAGAIGSLAGGMLADHGAEVVLIARDEHAAAINQNGLLIKSQDGNRLVRNLHAVTSPAQLKPHPDDVIILAVKTSQTSHSVQQLRLVFREDTPIFCLQNGVRNEEWASRRFLHVYGAMAGLSVSLLEPGVIAHTLSNRISIGNYPFNCDDVALKVAEQFSLAGFKTTTHESIMAVKWSKLLLNLNNATLAIINGYLQLGLINPALGNFMADVMEEGLHVLEVSGISLNDPNNPFDIKERIAQFRGASEEPEKVDQVQSIPVERRTYPSTWWDLYQQRGETEAGFLNGEIILLGEKHHLPTPFNSTLLTTVESMALESVKPGRYSLEELADLVEQRRLMLYHS
jgi:2-dehydropantoate 2-reductase